MFLFVRESFPFDQQFNILMRFIVDQTQTPNLKVTAVSAPLISPVGPRSSSLTNICLLSLQVKVTILKYIESLARQMDPTDFVNSSETRLAVSRIITWTTEPKSSDVRKVRYGGIVLLVGHGAGKMLITCAEHSCISYLSYG